MSKVKIGFVGCGQIARAHAAKYKEIADAEIVAVADVNADAARSFAEEFGAARHTTDFREVLAMEEIVAVDVCLHNNLHMPVTVAAFEAGKHVYCEKPMAGSYRDAERMLEVSRSTGKMLHIQLSTLYANETRAAKELIDGGEVGRIYHARSTGWRRRGRPFVDGYGTPSFVQKHISAGGALYDMGVYHISQMLYLLGNPKVSRISGQTYQECEMDEARRASSNYNVEELGLGLVRLEDNRTLDIIESWAMNFDQFESSYLMGTKAGLRLNPLTLFRTIGDLNLDCKVDVGAAGGRWWLMRPEKHHLGHSQTHWIEVLKGNAELLPTAEIALTTMLISEGIYLSSGRGEEVTAEEVRDKSASTAVAV